MPLDQHMKRRQSEREPGVEIRPDAVRDLLAMAGSVLKVEMTASVKDFTSITTGACERHEWRLSTFRTPPADSLSAVQIARVKERVAAAITDIRKHPSDLTSRLHNAEARVNRAAAIEVRRRLAEQWNAS